MDSLPSSPGVETLERARRTFGAAHAFPIRERYLLGPTDPLKEWSQATFDDLEEGPVALLVSPDHQTRLRSSDDLDGPWKASALPFGPGGRLGPMGR
jgi:hypothetical protein